ncbi:MAG: NAD(P)/FAD-dependent oxidoreductase [Bacteroidota bacterium]|nr:NAD(P)/FAD-dependent oxidoreductase [Bacteroidota bacterium]
MIAPTNKNIVVIGAGYGGVTAALRLSRLFRGHSEYQIHLVDKNPYHTLKTQLHEAAVHRREVSIDIGRIISRHKIMFHLGEVTKLGLTGKVISLGDSTIPFHVVVFALGSQSNFYSIPGLMENAFTLQSVADADRIYKHISVLCARASSENDRDRRREILRFIVGGGGLSGVEFAAELADHVAKCTQDYRIPQEDVEVLLIEALDKILPSLDESLRRQILKKLLDKRIQVLTNTKIVNCSPGTVTISPDNVLKTRTVVWTGGIRITQLTQESGMAIGSMGRIVVDEYLRSVDFSFVYAIGDNALAINPQTGKPVPAAAQFALQQGRLVAENIFADIFGERKKVYRPKVLGEVVSLGRHLAVGWLALPFIRKVRFVGFVGSLLKAAVTEKHILLLRKESRNWIVY